MDKINIRLKAMMVSFTVAILSSVCLGYYVMDESSFRKDQEQQIIAELALSQKLEAEIERREAEQIRAAATIQFSNTTELESSDARGEVIKQLLHLTNEIKAHQTTVKVTPAIDGIVGSQQEMSELKLGDPSKPVPIESFRFG